MSIKFIPAPSVWSMQAQPTRSSDAMNELTSEILSVPSQTSRLVLNIFLICGPVHLSCARHPVMAASASAASTSGALRRAAAVHPHGRLRGRERGFQQHVEYREDHARLISRR
jgi:hypothetical protein